MGEPCRRGVEPDRPETGRNPSNGHSPCWSKPGFRATSGNHERYGPRAFSVCWHMKILAVSPSCLMYSKIFLRLEPLGIELIAAAARRAGHEVRLLDLQVEP